MSVGSEKIRMKRCPSCFAKEVDVVLMYDKNDEEYYCAKCCYVGSGREIEQFYEYLKQQKYREIGSKRGLMDEGTL